MGFLLVPSNPPARMELRSNLAEKEQRAPLTKRVPAFCTLGLLILLLCQGAACFVGVGPSLAGKIDLRVFYASGGIVRSGHASQLYDYNYQRQVQNAVVGPRANALPFLYPPFAALLFVPLSLLSYRGAFFAQLILNLALLLSAALLLRPWLPAFRQRSWVLLPALYGCLFGVSVALMQGQISFALLLIYSGSYLLIRQRRNFLAGLLLSLALMKFQLVLPVVLLFLFWRQLRFIGGFLAGAAAAASASLAMVGTAGMASYWQSIFGMASQGARNAIAAKARYGMFPADMPNLHGLSYGLSHGAHWGQLLNLALCILVLGWAARQRASMLVALPAAMLVSYHMQPHDLTLLLLPLTFAWDNLLGRANGDDGGPASGLARPDYALFGAMLLLTLPLAAVAMGMGVNYLVAVAIAIIMVTAARGGHRDLLWLKKAQVNSQPRNA